MPLADRIRDLGVGVAFPRINLDGLVSPAPALAPAKREPDAALSAASLTVEEARKMLRATQMEAAHPWAHHRPPSPEHIRDTANDPSQLTVKERMMGVAREVKRRVEDPRRWLREQPRAVAETLAATNASSIG